MMNKSNYTLMFVFCACLLTSCTQLRNSSSKMVSENFVFKDLPVTAKNFSIPKEQLESQLSLMSGEQEVLWRERMPSLVKFYGPIQTSEVLNMKYTRGIFKDEKRDSTTLVIVENNNFSVAIIIESTHVFGSPPRYEYSNNILNIYDKFLLDNNLETVCITSNTASGTITISRDDGFSDWE